MHYAHIFPQKSRAIFTFFSADNSYMAINSYQILFEYLEKQGVTTVLLKQLSENDNSKQQIYFGGSFEALNQIPFGQISIDKKSDTPNFKAPLDFYWLNESMKLSKAPAAQLILYPNYPEVRLSGFLRSCPTAPNEHMKPYAKDVRKGKLDGRILFLGITSENKIIAYLSLPGTPLTTSIEQTEFLKAEKEGVFWRFYLKDSGDNKSRIISALQEIVNRGWHESRRLTSNGATIEYNNPNAGGYTLEALLHIIPNGIPEPDKYGWEIKAFSGRPVTLMTPEPDEGDYVEKGFIDFVKCFGHHTHNDKIYFTGTHRHDIKNKTTRLKLVTNGFDHVKGKISDVNGGICLVSLSDRIVAKWSYKKLVEHWSTKHNRAVYIPFKTRSTDGKKKEYKFSRTIGIGSGTDFTLFLDSLVKKYSYYDPASWIIYTEDKSIKQKRRNQFRITSKFLHSLYFRFEEYSLE